MIRRLSFLFLTLSLMFISGCDMETATSEIADTASADSIEEKKAPQSIENEVPHTVESEKAAEENLDDDSTINEAEKATKDSEEDLTDQITSSEKLEGLKVHYIDVGQADSALLEYSQDGVNYNILIDSGDWNSNAVVNYLSHRKVTHLDIIVGTHPHADHIGQIDKIINQFEVDEVWLSGDTTTSQVFERVIDAIDKNGIGYHEPRAGEVYDIGPLVVEVVSPQSINGDLNNGSIAMKLTYGEVSFLFTGDAEQKAESAMLNRGHDLNADILKLGHHGSNTSTTPAFLEAVNPKVGIISAGANNQYGHPHDEVISRVKEKGIDLYSTHINGTIIVETDGQSYKVTTKEDGNVTPSSAGTKKEPAKPKQETAKKEPSDEKAKGNPNCVDINSAGIDEIQNIIHIGPVRAEDLINLRPFNSVDDLTKIKGIGPSRIKDIVSQGLACVGG